MTRCVYVSFPPSNGKDLFLSVDYASSNISSLTLPVMTFLYFFNSKREKPSVMLVTNNIFSSHLLTDDGDLAELLVVFAILLLSCVWDFKQSGQFDRLTIRSVKCAVFCSIITYEQFPFKTRQIIDNSKLKCTWSWLYRFLQNRKPLEYSWTR